MAYLAAAIAPGADTTLVLTRALDSRGKAWLAGAGIAAAKVLLLVIAYLGASALLIQNPELLLAVKFFGAGFLGYRAVVIWRRSKLSEPPKESSGWADFGFGFGTAFTNPQPLAFYLAIVPQVAATTNLLVLSLIVILGFALVTLVYSSLAKPISSALTKRGPGFVNRVVAVLLLIVAAWILLR